MLYISNKDITVVDMFTDYLWTQFTKLLEVCSK